MALSLATVEKIARICFAKNGAGAAIFCNKYNHISAIV
jgi:hypothetical protein